MIRRRSILVDIFAVVITTIVFVGPLLFVFFQASKSDIDAFTLEFSPPKEWHLVDNFKRLLTDNDGLVLLALKNTIVLTILSVILLVLLAAMAAFVIQRRPGPISSLANYAVLAGLIVPPAVVPTIWVMQRIHLFKTLPGLVLIEVAYGLAFAIMLFRGFMSSIPKDLDEAAMLDGCGPYRLFFRVILPLLRPVTWTTVIVYSVAVFNDFTNPLYFLPGSENATLQLTLYNFNTQYDAQFNMLFADILFITLPPLIAFMIFSKKIVEGMTGGAVKG